MAAERRGQSPLHLPVADPAPPIKPPSLSALFLIYFDNKAGYTIGWQRSTGDLSLEGVVEYKSLPSGLHAVAEDLVYFVHNDQAGLSAFVNTPADAEARNARMIAVGAMVPVICGRLGRVWEHAERLQQLARSMVIETKAYDPMEEFWEQHRIPGPASASSGVYPSDPGGTDGATDTRDKASHTEGYHRQRSASDGALLLKQPQTLSKHHPAWSLPSLIELFGPLIYPIHRAALLRKRLLIVTHAPVIESCNMVYNLSVLSNVPSPALDIVDVDAPQRSRPLFAIGVHDIPLLEKDARYAQKSDDADRRLSTSGAQQDHGGWIACTTDSILAVKTALYDVIITMPSPGLAEPPAKGWPKVETSHGTQIRATQRDLRRYTALRRALACAAQPYSSSSSIASTSDFDTAGDTSALLPSPNGASSPPAPAFKAREPSHPGVTDTESITEPVSWSRLAYSSYMWWASAGEQRYHTQEEAENDAALIVDLPLSEDSARASENDHDVETSSSSDQPRDAKREMAIVAYFHRLTMQMLTVMGEAIDAAEDEEAGDDEADTVPPRPSSNGYHSLPVDAEENNAVPIASQELARMGLDAWSADSIDFVEDMGILYYGRPIRIEGRNFDICGIRVC